MAIIYSHVKFHPFSLKNVPVVSKIPMTILNVKLSKITFSGQKD